MELPDRRREGTKLMMRAVPLVVFSMRVLMGLFFLYEAEHQIAGGWIGGDGLERMLRSALDGNSIPGPYRRFLEDVVIEHDQLFTAMVIPGEIAVGIALILGLATRATAAVALSMNANFFVMNGAVTGGAILDAVFVVMEVGLILFASRQAWSADGWLARHGIAVWWMSGDIGAVAASGVSSARE